jgi:fibronectin type 3 domain-containing protein
VFILEHIFLMLCGGELMKNKIACLFIVAVLLLTSFFIVSTNVKAQSETVQSLCVGSSEIEHAGLQKAMGFFTENKGQFHEDIRFVTTTDFGKILFYDSKVIYDLNIYQDCKVVAIDQITLTFPGCNLVKPYGVDLQSHKSNFFIGEKSDWIIGVRNFNSVEYRGLWDGIDLVYKFSENGVKYEFILAPKAPVEIIKVKVDGASLTQGTDSLSFITARGCLTDANLAVLQEGSERKVQASFVAQRGEFGFSVPGRDMARRLTIDPLIYSTYMGGSGLYFDYGMSIASDPYGNAYVTGTTQSIDFPLSNPYQENLHGYNDAYVLKLSPDGSELLYSTFIGGDGNERGVSVTVDPNGIAYVIGETNSTDFPVVNPWQAGNNDGEDLAFILQLDPEGEALLFSTYFGGNGTSSHLRMTLGKDGCAYFTGQTNSTSFELINASQDEFGGGPYDSFVFKLAPDFRTRTFSTFIGGSDYDNSESIVVDSAGNVYLCGITGSTDFPLKNAIQDTYHGNGDGFLVKLNPSDGKVVYSTYFGGGDGEQGLSLAVDPEENCIVTGSTWSSDFPLMNPLQTTKGALSDIFILKVSPSGSDLVYSSYVGGNHIDWPVGCSVDEDGNAIVCAYTISNDLQVHDGIQILSGGSGDAYIFKLNVTGDALLFSSYLGGSGDDMPTSFAFDDMNNVYLTGGTDSYDFPIHDAYQSSYGGGVHDTFIVKLRISSAPQAVRNVTASAGEGQTILHWQEPNDDGGSNITNYIIYRGTSPGEETRLIKIGNVLSYIDAPLTNGKAYFYKISAYNSVGEGPLSDEVSATPASVPTTPRGLKAFAGDSIVDLNWTAPEYLGPGLLMYHLFRNGSEIWNGTETSYTDNGLLNQIAYSYSVAANNSLGWGPNSTTVVAMPMPPDSVPAVPLGLTATPGNLEVELNWTEPIYSGPGTITYHVFRNSVLIWNGSSNSCIDSGLTKGLEHSYTVAAQNSVGWGLNSTLIIATPFGVPDPPWGLTASPGDGSAYLTWNTVNYSGPGTLTYHLFRDNILMWSGQSTSHTDTSLTNGQGYEFKASASNSVGWSTNCTIVTVTPQGPPTSPRNLGAVAGDSYVLLSWLSPTYVGPGTLTYHLFRGGSLIWSGVSSAYNDTSVSNGLDYTYTISAQNSLGWGVNSSSVSATPMQTPVPPDAPMGLQAMASDGKITLTWQAPSQIGTSPITAYKVYRGTSSGAETYLDSVGDVLTFTDTGLTNGQAYFYKVKAVSSAGDGDLSQEATATPVSSDTGGSDDMIWIAAGVAVVALAAIGGAMIYMRRRK